MEKTCGKKNQCCISYSTNLWNGTFRLPLLAVPPLPPASHLSPFKAYFPPLMTLPQPFSLISGPLALQPTPFGLAHSPAHHSSRWCSYAVARMHPAVRGCAGVMNLAAVLPLTRATPQTLQHPDVRLCWCDEPPEDPFLAV